MTTHSLSAIVAVGLDGAIGQAGGLPWGPLKADWCWFRQHTVGRVVIMGRRTMKAIGRPLRDRHSVVLSRSRSRYFGCPAVGGVDEAMQVVRELGHTSAVVIGGAEVYWLFMPLVTTLYATVVHARFPDADAFFPGLEPSEWSPTTAPVVVHDGAYRLTFREYTRVAQTAEVVR